MTWLSPTGLTTELWKQIPPILVPTAAVVPTQQIASEHVIDKLGSHCGDMYSHVVVIDGCWFLEDGHHRHAFAVEQGEALWPARVFVQTAT